MKSFAIFAVLLLAVYAQDENQSCYNDVTLQCDNIGIKDTKFAVPCNSIYGGFESVEMDLKNYAKSHLQLSMKYLLMSTHFANYEINREGFAKLFRKLSDETWADAIDVIKHVGKRGGVYSPIEFKAIKADNNKFGGNKTVELYEIHAMSRAVENHKELAKEAIKIHEEVTHLSKSKHDPELAHYLEECSEKHAETIRNLVGHVTDMSKIMVHNDKSLFLYQFDQYLLKTV